MAYPEKDMRQRIPVVFHVAFVVFLELGEALDKVPQEVDVGDHRQEPSAPRPSSSQAVSALEDPRAVELLAMTAHYHRGGKLGLGHTLPVGEPWVPGSRCDCLLVSWDPHRPSAI
jgi:hypothetical protein